MQVEDIKLKIKDYSELEAIFKKDLISLDDLVCKVIEQEVDIHYLEDEIAKLRRPKEENSEYDPFDVWWEHKNE